jgi:hypothetical protein
MILMRADALRGQVVGGWALKIETFLSPEMATSKRVPFLGPKWHSPNASMPFHRGRAQKRLDFQGLTPSHVPS